jgi:hypothetical protein
MRRFRAGYYRYKGYLVRNHGYFVPDKCVWWEAINELTEKLITTQKQKKNLNNLLTKVRNNLFVYNYYI